MPLPAIGIGAGMLLSAAANVGGSLFANRANAREAQRNRDFQERMSSTAYTRARADMLNAGINPAQLAAGGSAASSPGGAVATVENPLAGGIAGARDAARASAEIENMRDTNRLIDAQIRKTRTEAATSEALGSVHTETARKIAQDRVFGLEMQPLQKQQITIGNLLNALATPGAKNEAELQKKLGVSGAAIPFILNNAKAVKAMIR